MTLEDVLQSPPLPPPAKTVPVTDLVVVKPYAPPQAVVTTMPSRRLPMIIEKPEKGDKGSGCAEVAGGTTAECAAVVCCCPCGLANLLVLAVVRLPAGLCRKALLKKRRQRVKKKLLGSRPGSFDDDEDLGLPRIVPETWPVKPPSVEVSEKEKEMWGQFHGAGFWRSPSQRD